MLKGLIIVFMVLLVASLGSGLYFLLVDQGDKNSRRTLHSLGVRLGLALGLATVIVYGVATGQLGHGNPWDAGPESAASRAAE
ncbi:DUF2909 domain-containing protein [Pseudohaliea rubra]|uniref:DUF2909 domain-containing protein n=1 Tax=Pseudohaliea rubra DSM 19751 TaxID=1265313 RepID=A0A095X1S7_9GAMM|nr:DUF2909 domain-containing protein [Pseudohaliea rubra]KGE04829.1 hypothetical protein HRUBRA_00582 [Pseudohaliea rubra DSM 19751]